MRHVEVGMGVITVVHMAAVVVRLHEPRRVGRVGVERIQVRANIVDGPEVLKKKVSIAICAWWEICLPARLLLPW